MFEDINEMEREIETFRKNVIASSELVEGISRLTAETKKQKESFSTSTEELLHRLDDCLTQFKSDHEAALRTLSNSNDATIKKLQKNLSSEQQARITELDRIQAEFKANQADAIEKAEIQQNAFINKLLETESVIKGCQLTTETKYAESISKLDACVAQFRSDHDAALHTLRDSNNAAIETFQKNLSADQETWIAELQQIKTALESCQAEAIKEADEQIHLLTNECDCLIAEMKTELAIQQNTYAEKLQKTEQVIRGYQFTAEQKYKEFINHLETTNVDQIFKEVQDLKKSIQMKYAMLLCGIGLTLVVSLLSILLK
jgi:ethanolamine utilization cobalamin adenosyltransferase